jgi:hypothetical protein
MERRVPVSRLNSVDLPTLGRPKITSDGSICVILLKRRADNQEPQQRYNLPLYRIPPDSAHLDTQPSVTNHSERSQTVKSAPCEIRFALLANSGMGVTSATRLKAKGDSD